MQPAEAAVDESRLPSASKERPWLFAFLIAPDAVISLGLVGGALTFLLRNEGVDPSRAASISALIALPHAIYFFWGPITDFWFQRRTWLLITSAITAAAIVAAFHLPRLGSTLGVGLLFLAACVAVLAPAACGGIMGTLQRERSRRLASSFYQTGSLVIGAVAVFSIASTADHASLGVIGFLVAAMIVLPALVAFIAPSQPVISGHSLRQTASLIFSECKSTFLRWEAIPFTMLIVGPFGSGAMIGLLGALARDYGVSAQQVAWMNGLGGAFLTAGGALAASLIPARVHATVSFLIAGIVNAATLLILAFCPLRPSIYFMGTVCFLFTVGICYALFTGVTLEFMGGSGKSGSARYSIINSLGNIPVVYMTWLDGRGYALWGTRGMPGIDAIFSGIYASIFLAHFIVSRRRKLARGAA